MNITSKVAKAIEPSKFPSEDAALLQVNDLPTPPPVMSRKSSDKLSPSVRKLSDGSDTAIPSLDMLVLDTYDSSRTSPCDRPTSGIHSGASSPGAQNLLRKPPKIPSTSSSPLSHDHTLARSKGSGFSADSSPASLHKLSPAKERAYVETLAGYCIPSNYIDRHIPDKEDVAASPKQGRSFASEFWKVTQVYSPTTTQTVGSVDSFDSSHISSSDEEDDDVIGSLSSNEDEAGEVFKSLKVNSQEENASNEGTRPETFQVSQVSPNSKGIPRYKEWCQIVDDKQD